MKIKIAIVVILLCASVAGQSKQSIVLGVLEDVPAKFGSAPDVPNFRVVRVVFQKSGNDWHPLPSHCPDEQCLKTISSQFPAEMTWTIAFDGKNLGRVSSRTPKTYDAYAAVGHQEITTKGPLPTVGKRSGDFAGQLDIPVYRPLVANSKPYFEDPDGWKPSSPEPKSIAALREAFRKKYPKLCQISKQGQATLVPLSYRNNDVKVVKAYISKNGWKIARLHLEAIDCEDTEAGFDIDDPWFCMDPQGSTKFFGTGIWLVDAGDYDNDGKSELLFSINRDNRGGYELFYDDFKKHAVYEFSYH